MILSYDPLTDSLYVFINPFPITCQEAASDYIDIDYAGDIVVGIRFIYVTRGIDLDNIPYRAKIKKLLAKKGFPVRNAD